MSKEFETTRVPGRMSRILGRSLRLMLGSRNIVTTVALEKSVANRSACMNDASSVTPASFAFRRDSSTMSGLYSTPIARVPRFAAVMTVRPSPEPRSIRRSAGVTCARSSMRSTSACAVGTQITSLPDWPTRGSNGAFGSANASPAATIATAATGSDHANER